MTKILRDPGPSRDPVVPNFPIYTDNMFRSVVSGKEVGMAVVGELPVTAEELIDVLAEDYPALPRHVLAPYVEDSLAAADKLDIGTKVYVDKKNHALCDERRKKVGETNVYRRKGV